MFFALLAALSTATAEPVEWRSMLGWHVSPQSNGVFDMAVRGEQWQAGLYTDTVDVRWTPEGDRGRSWVGARGEAFIAGVSNTPWYGGAPAPELGWFSSYAGLEAGTVRYGPSGTYLGLEGHTRRTWLSESYLGPTVDTAAADLAPTLDLVPFTDLRGEVVFGYWSKPLQAWLGVGAHVVPDATDPVTTGETWQPKSRLEVVWRPTELRIAPRAELRAGWGAGQGFLQRAQVGGLSPYVVPIGGAGWGEFRAQQYVAARVGGTVHQGIVEVSAVVDPAWLERDLWTPAEVQTTDPTSSIVPVATDLFVTGSALMARVEPGRFFAEGALGYGLVLDRAPGVSPLGGWLLVGMDWGTGLR